MKTKSRSRAKAELPESIRPAWMMNCVIFAALLSAIGGCYVWLGVKKNERAAQINLVKREIEDLKKQRDAAVVEMERKLDTRLLNERVARAELDLKPIPIGPRGGRLVRLPEPAIKPDAGTPAQTPSPARGPLRIAATQQP